MARFRREFAWPGFPSNPGQGGSIGWADFDANLAVAICHNRLFNATSVEEDAILIVANAVREALGPGL